METEHNLVTVFSGNHGHEQDSLLSTGAKKLQQASIRREPAKKDVYVIGLSSLENHQAAP